MKNRPKYKELYLAERYENSNNKKQKEGLQKLIIDIESYVKNGLVTADNGYKIAINPVLYNDCWHTNFSAYKKDIPDEVDCYCRYRSFVMKALKDKHEE